MSFLKRWIFTAIAVQICVFILPGVHAIGVDGGAGWIGVLSFAFFLGFVNAVVKPVLKLLSLPLNIVTFGIFSFILNTFCLLIAAWLARSLTGVGIVVDGFLWAMIASCLISFVSGLFGVSKE